MGKDQPVPLAKDYEKLRQKLEKKDEPGLSGLRGKTVRIRLRGGAEVEGTIISVQTYELEVEGTLRLNATNVIANGRKRYIVLKHAIDVVEVE